MLEPLTNEAHEKPTLDDALGLMDKSRRTFAPPPQEKSREYVSDSSRAIVDGLNGLLTKHKELPVSR